MKKLLTLAFALSLSMFAQAQFITPAATAGVGYSSFRNGSAVSDGGISYRAGVNLRIKLLGLYVQPGVVYQYLDDGMDNGFTSSQLDIPVNLGFKILIVDLNTGPVLNIPLSGNAAGVDVKDALAPTSFSWQVGAGVELGPIHVGVRYQGSVTDAFDDPGYTESTRWRNIYAHIEYQF